MTRDYKVANLDHHEAIVKTRRMEEGPPGSVMWSPFLFARPCFRTGPFPHTSRQEGSQRPAGHRRR